MFILKMRVPARDVLRVLARGEVVGDAYLHQWLERGRRPLMKRREQLEQQYWQQNRQELQQEFQQELQRQLHSFLEDLFETDDPVEAPVRAAAYRVEGRRTLVRVIDLLAVSIIALFALIALRMYLSGSEIISIAILSGFGVLLSREVQRWGLRKAIRAIPFGNPLDPVAWGLYYPIQLAEKAMAAGEELRAEGQRTPLERFEELQSQIARAPDGKALPGQEEKITALAAEVHERLPKLAMALDPHSLASGITERAVTAAVLVRDELNRKLSQSWISGNDAYRGVRGPAVTTLADRIAHRAYSSLMECAERLATLPGPDILKTAPDSTLSSHAVVELLHVSKTVASTAMAAVDGQLPSASGEAWSLPDRRAVEVAQQAGILGCLLVGVSLVTRSDPGLEHITELLENLGTPLLAGLVAPLLERINQTRPARA